MAVVVPRNLRMSAEEELARTLSPPIQDLVYSYYLKVFMVAHCISYQETTRKPAPSLMSKSPHALPSIAEYLILAAPGGAGMRAWPPPATVTACPVPLARPTVR